MPKLKHLLYEPENPASQENWPLVIFLHGAGERGDHTDLLLKYGPPREFETWGSKPFYCLAPQCPEDDWWTELIPELEELLEEVLAAYPIDPDRISLTGFSMGGFGTWQWAIARPERFSALAPIAGSGFATKSHKVLVKGKPADLKNLRGIPIRILHGGKDPVVPAFLSRTFAAICGYYGCDHELIIFPGADHGEGCDQAYEDGSLLLWLSEQRRK